MTSHPASTSAWARARASAAPPTAAATRSRPCWSLLESGYWRRLKMSLMVMRPLRSPCLSTTGSFSMPCLASSRSASASGVPTGALASFSFVITSRIGRSSSRSNCKSRFVMMPTSLPAPSTIGTPEILKRTMSCCASLHAIDLGGLPVDRHVLVDDADAALARHRDRHFRFGDRVHRGGHDRDIQGNGAREAAGDFDVAGMHRRVTGHEQDVVEGQGDVGSEGSHGGSYWGGLVSSTGFLVASSTAAFPAATTPSKNLPAFPTASIVPRMIVTGTRPARIVSSSVSATF